MWRSELVLSSRTVFSNIFVVAGEMAFNAWKINVLQNVIDVTFIWDLGKRKCFQKIPKKFTQQFLHELIFIKIPQYSKILLGYICKRIWCQKVSKIAQSGHSAHLLTFLRDPDKTAPKMLSISRPSWGNESTSAVSKLSYKNGIVSGWSIVGVDSSGNRTPDPGDLCSFLPQTKALHRKNGS